MIVFAAADPTDDGPLRAARRRGDAAAARRDGWRLGRLVPDSLSIAFVSKGKLKRVLAAGGRPQDLCDVTGFHGGTWNREGTILFGSASGVYSVSAEGSPPVAITTIDQSESGHLWPHFLPDGRRYLYLAKSGDAAKSGVYAGELGSKDRTRVLAVDSNAVYAEPGVLVFERAGTVFAQPFTPGRCALREPTDRRW
jgi:hypothetical protein